VGGGGGIRGRGRGQREVVLWNGGDQSINQCYICSNEIHREFMPAIHQKSLFGDSVYLHLGGGAGVKGRWCYGKVVIVFIYMGGGGAGVKESWCYGQVVIVFI
jgi:hypothetical protein